MLVSKTITLTLLRSEAYYTAQSIHLYEALPDEVDTQYIMHHAKKADKHIAWPHKDPYKNEITDLIIVPGRKFDLHNNRHGRGGGYYDRFLATTHATKIALAFNSQIYAKLSTKPHDIPMDVIITEQQVIKKGDCNQPPHFYHNYND